MKKIIWSEKNLHLLGKIFIRNVLDNMRGYQESSVQFGETGEGVVPNYLITFPNGNKWIINGRSHDTFGGAEDFKIGNISEIFKLHQVQKAYEES